MNLWHRRKRPPRPSEGERARRRAEEALAEVRARKAAQRSLLWLFRHEYEQNGYGHDVDALWEGRRR